MPGSETTYGYDADGLLTEVAGPAGSSTVTYTGAKVSAHRTASGQRFALDYGSDGTEVASVGPIETYAHDEQGRLTQIRFGDAEVLLVAMALMALPFALGRARA